MGSCFIKTKPSVVPEDKFRERSKTEHPAENFKNEGNSHTEKKEFQKSTVNPSNDDVKKIQPRIKYTNNIIFHNNKVLENYHTNVIKVASRRVSKLSMKHLPNV
jgi:hypothetical protein